MSLGDRLRTTDLGPEQQCTRCKEWWPQEREFFCFDKNASSGFNCWCKACCAEDKQRRRQPQPTTTATAAALPW